LPGPTAFVPALLVSGFPVNEFVFAGFLPQKKGRQTRLKTLSSETRTILFYESPNRLEKLLEELLQTFGANRKASVSREISKLYEETQRGTLMELCAYYKEKHVKGEIVVVVQGLI
jgi:16S rRNA (cytidine1402-2'-O)-methyltransferase